MSLQLAAPDFLEPAAETIAGHPGGLKFGNDQSHPWVARRIVRPDHVEMLETAAPAFGEAAANVGRAREPVGSRKARRLRQEPPCFEGSDTVRRFRPFLRRRDSTARPQRDAIRARNPCLLIRRLLRGRYDGFIVFDPCQSEPWKLVGHATGVKTRGGSGSGGQRVSGEREKIARRSLTFPHPTRNISRP